ncbi:MAG: universal stress protein [Nevskiaceae bacterium]|nr:universal stress protein [Nevskiaceae bacterium]
MKAYSRILAVVDLSHDSQHIAHRALQMAACHPGAQLTLLHIVEFVPVEPLSDSLLPAVQVESELLASARERLAQLADTLSTPPPPWRVESGNVKVEIVRAAREGGFDLIVIGSHERHGLSILLNLTEDTVLHAAPCDVLAVRLPMERA